MVDSCEAKEKDLNLLCPGCNYKLRRVRKSRSNECRELICPGCGHMFTDDDVENLGPEKD